MRRKHLVCRSCGYEGEIPILSPEEAEEARRRREPIGPARCPRCGSSNVSIHE